MNYFHKIPKQRTTYFIYIIKQVVKKQNKNKMEKQIKMPKEIITLQKFNEWIENNKITFLTKW